MQALCKDARMLPAGGAPEIELCQQLQKFGRKETGLDQYAIAKFAESLEVRALFGSIRFNVCYYIRKCLKACNS